MLRTHLRPAIVHHARALRVITGLVYPGLVTGLAQVLFPRQANGSLVIGERPGGRQRADRAAVHAGRVLPPAALRPRAAGYDATASAGTNKGPTDPQARRHARGRRGRRPRWRRMAPSGPGALRHGDVIRLRPRSAHLPRQRRPAGRPRGAGARRRWIPQSGASRRHTEGRQFGFFGEPRVNVLLLNLALDSLVPRDSP